MKNIYITISILVAVAAIAGINVVLIKIQDPKVMAIEYCFDIEGNHYDCN